MGIIIPCLTHTKTWVSIIHGKIWYIAAQHYDHIEVQGGMTNSETSEIKMHPLSARSAVSFLWPHPACQENCEHQLLLPITCMPGFCYRNLSSPGYWTTTQQSGPQPQNCSRVSCCPHPRWRNQSCTRCCTTPWPTWTGRPIALWWPRSSPSGYPLPSITPMTATYWRWASAGLL